MKSIITFLSCFICFQLFASCNKSSEIASTPGSATHTGTLKTPTTHSMKVKLTIGTNTFIATLPSNATVDAFKSSLPLTINMKDLNANEKYYDLPKSLPANASNPGTIQAGDLMLYSSNTLVLFYKSFSTSYNYTPMGRIDDVKGLTDALGSGNVSVTFALIK